MGDRVKGARDKALADFADNVVRLAKINIGKTYTAKNSQGKSYKKRIDNSGKLRNSITSELKTRTEDGRFSKGFIIFKMLEYGLNVDKGRRAGKGVPPQVLIDWIKKKPLRIRDLETGSFVKQTESRVKGLAYVINRKIKKFGIPATNFFTDAYESQETKFIAEMQEAIAQDNTQYISTQIDTINANSTKKP
tara:strand:- start:703 stop:1278 length:576 start_codon:yes stop_codon:yes gene_type:complete